MQGILTELEAAILWPLPAGLLGIGDVSETPLSDAGGDILVREKGRRRDICSSSVTSYDIWNLELEVSHKHIHGRILHSQPLWPRLGALRPAALTVTATFTLEETLQYRLVGASSRVH